MPMFGSGQTFADGTRMKSVWPYLYYEEATSSAMTRPGPVPPGGPFTFRGLGRASSG